MPRPVSTAPSNPDHQRAVPACERISLLNIAPQPWKNGAGVTREIAAAPGDDGAFDWRFSLAEVDRDAPFSAFPGIDRCIVLLHGAGMRLRASDGTLDHRLVTTLEPFHFAGETPLAATLVGGACSDFNVMTRRGVFRADVTCIDCAGTVPGADTVLLLCCSGEWAVAGADAPSDPPLPAMHALLWRAPVGPIGVRPLGSGDGARLLQVRLCHDRAP